MCRELVSWQLPQSPLVVSIRNTAIKFCQYGLPNHLQCKWSIKWDRSHWHIFIIFKGDECSKNTHCLVWFRFWLTSLMLSVLREECKPRISNDTLTGGMKEWKDRLHLWRSGIFWDLAMSDDDVSITSSEPVSDVDPAEMVRLMAVSRKTFGFSQKRLKFL